MYRIYQVVIIVWFICVGFGVSAKEKPFIQTKTKKLLAVSITSDTNGILTYKTKSLTQKLNPEEYVYARIPMPTEIRRAAKKLKSKKYADVTSELGKAYKKFRFLGWDVFCKYYIGVALEKQGKTAEAITTLNEIVEPPKDKKKMADYFKAMKLLVTLYIADAKFDKADSILTKIGSADDQEIFVFVNNSRGDIFSKKGKYKDALLMYMRTIMFCTKENNKKERAEALLKVIKILKADKNNRYREFEKMLKTDYPTSPLIKKL